MADSALPPTSSKPDDSALPPPPGEPLEAAPLPGAAVGVARSGPRLPWRNLGAFVLVGLTMAAVTLAWNTQQRLRQMEQELVRRQQDSQDQSTEARLLAKQSSESSTQLSAKMALLETRVAEAALQRSQVEELIQSMSRSRDENLLADVEAAVRVAQQQSSITGSLDPLLSALKQADERLARQDQPRVERVRRAVARDLDRARGASVADLPTLSVRLDELIRQVDDLPLLSQARHRAEAIKPNHVGKPGAPASAASSPAEASWWEGWRGGLERMGEEVWREARALVRVTRIDHPDAMLLAPEQAFFLRENLKLRLLNARLALLSRQFDLAQSDLAQAKVMLDQYYDRSTKRVSIASEQLGMMINQSRQGPLPRADETLAALAAAAAGR